MKKNRRPDGLTFAALLLLAAFAACSDDAGAEKPGTSVSPKAAPPRKPASEISAGNMYAQGYRRAVSVELTSFMRQLVLAATGLRAEGEVRIEKIVALSGGEKTVREHFRGRLPVYLPDAQGDAVMFFDYDWDARDAVVGFASGRAEILSAEDFLTRAKTEGFEDKIVK